MKIQNHVYFILFSIISILCSTSCSNSFNQMGNASLDNKYKPYYQDKIEPGSKIIRARVHYSLEQTSDGKYIYKVYYPEKEIKTDQITFRDKQMSIKEGPYQTWYDDGTRKIVGSYKNNKAHGTWTYFSNDLKSIEAIYVNDIQIGEQIEFDSIGRKSAVFTYGEDLKNGPFKIYSGDSLIIKGLYNAGELVEQKCLYPDKEDYIARMIKTPNIILPKWKDKACNAISDLETKQACANRKMLEHIIENITYPLYAREEGIQGTALINFTITSEGEIKDIKAIKGICAGIEEECIRIVKTFPKWHPGTLDGKPSNIDFTVPIKFRVE